MIASLHQLLTLANLIWEKNKQRKGDLSPMIWTRVLLWEPLKKGLKKSRVFRHLFGKILLNKKYKCVLCEKFNKHFCYCKINRYMFWNGLTWKTWSCTNLKNFWKVCFEQNTFFVEYQELKKDTTILQSHFAFVTININLWTCSDKFLVVYFSHKATTR